MNDSDRMILESELEYAAKVAEELARNLRWAKGNKMFHRNQVMEPFDVAIPRLREIQGRIKPEAGR